MNFQQALAAMAAGQSVRRPSMAAGVSVYRVTSLVVNGAAAASATMPTYAYASAVPGLQAYSPSQADMAATDWVQV